MQIAEGLYAFLWDGQGHNCNSYAIRYSLDGSPRYVVIDPGKLRVLVANGTEGEKEYRGGGFDSLLGKMEADGIRPEDVALVIVTHAHGDHCGSAYEFSRRGARVAVHKDDAQKYLTEVMDGYQDGKPDKEDIRPDVLLTEGELLLGAPAPIHLWVIHTPGHLPGSIALWWDEKKALFSGDTVFLRRVGRTDIAGGDPKAMRSSVRRLAVLKAEYLLAGHGNSGVIVGSEEVARNFELVIRARLPAL
ncbi:MAG: MBL fold metallo-hydrolase [Chloroflexi bacterium]|nr:MBL fold metallo-hydrolase [Chloroflexota bacterium]